MTQPLSLQPFCSLLTDLGFLPVLSFLVSSDFSSKLRVSSLLSGSFAGVSDMELWSSEAEQPQQPFQITSPATRTSLRAVTLVVHVSLRHRRAAL